MARAFTLDSAEQRNRDNPATFQIPSREDRETLKAGDLAKLNFLNAGTRGERMWVLITRRLQDGGYVGTLADKPDITLLLRGDVVRFGPEHVIEIRRKA